MLLILVLVIPVILVSSFAESSDAASILVETDQSSYEVGDSVIISGIVEEKKMPVAAIRVFDPDEKILSANEVEILDDNTFSKTINLETPIYEKIGTYSIVINYGKLETETYFEIGSESSESEEPSEDFSGDFSEFEFPEVLVVTDKDVYEDGDTILITGLVSQLKEPTVLVGIYDPLGFPAGFYFGDVSPELEFTVSFPAKSGVNFKSEGTYSVIARYGDSEDKITFEFVKQIQNDSDDTDTPEDKNDNKDEEPKQPFEDENNSEPDDNTKNPNDQNPDYENTSKTKEEKKSNTEEKKTKQPSQNNSNQNSQNQNPNNKPPSQQKESNNLSVGDMELGKILNKMNLECNKSEYAEIISYYDSMGPALIRLCKYGEAITYYDSTLLQDPKNVEALTNKGSALSSLGYHKEAISFFDSALDVDSRFIPAINNKANALASLGKFEEAIPLYVNGLKINPEETILYSNLEKAQEKYSIMQQKEQPMVVVQNEAAPPIEQTEQKPIEINREQNEPNFIEQIGSAISSISESLRKLLS